MYNILFKMLFCSLLFFTLCPPLEASDEEIFQDETGLKRKQSQQADCEKALAVLDIKGVENFLENPLQLKYVHLNIKQLGLDWSNVVKIDFHDACLTGIAVESLSKHLAANKFPNLDYFCLGIDFENISSLQTIKELKWAQRYHLLFNLKLGHARLEEFRLPNAPLYFENDPERKHRTFCWGGYVTEIPTILQIVTELNEHLSSLVLSSLMLNTKDLKVLCSLTLPNLISLRLMNAKLAKKEIIELCNAAFLKNLVTLSLSGNCLKDEDVIILMKNKMPSLAHLNLVDNKITQTGPMVYFVYANTNKHINLCLSQVAVSKGNDLNQLLSDDLEDSESLDIKSPQFMGNSDEDTREPVRISIEELGKENIRREFKNGNTYEGHGCTAYFIRKATDNGLTQRLPKQQSEGVFTWSDGMVYEGGFYRGMRHGQGTLRYPNGTLCRGVFYEGMIEGPATVIFPNRDKLIAEFETGEIKGKVTYIATNETVFTGEFLNGQKHGLGMIKYPNGSCFVGNFSQGKITGKGTHIEANKTIFTGEFLNDQKHGPAEMQYANGNKLYGTFTNGELSLDSVTLKFFNMYYKGSLTKTSIPGKYNFFHNYVTYEFDIRTGNVT